MKIEDLIGQRFGIREVIGHEVKRRTPYLIMRCDCGRINSSEYYSVINGESLSCIHCKPKLEKKRPLPVVKDRKYRKFLSFVESPDGSELRFIKVQCVCGAISTIRLTCFNAGRAESCGSCGQIRRTSRLNLTPEEDARRFLTDKERNRLRFFVTTAGSQRKLAEKINMPQYRISEALNNRYRTVAGRLMRSLDKISEEMKENKNA